MLLSVVRYAEDALTSGAAVTVPTADVIVTADPEAVSDAADNSVYGADTVKGNSSPAEDGKTDVTLLPHPVIITSSNTAHRQIKRSYFILFPLSLYRMVLPDWVNSFSAV